MNPKTLVCDTGERPAWRVSGERAMPFLHDMLSQDLAGLTAGHGALAALLTEKGRVRAIVRVLTTADGAVIDVDPAAAGSILDGLARIAPLGGAALLPQPRRLIRLVGDAAPGIADGLGPDENDHVEDSGAILIRTAWGGTGIDVLAEPDRAGAWLERLGVSGTVVAPSVLDAVRIRDGRPVYGIDVDESTLINETPLLERAVSFTKGCYPGQESVARVRNLGQVQRRLISVEVGGAPPAPGSAVRRGDAHAGMITSAAPDDGGAVALAMIDAGVERGEMLTVAGSTARVL